MSFLLMLFCENEGGLHQWKAVVGLLCGCERAVDERPALFKALVNCLLSQFALLPDDFFIDPLLSENFLSASLQSLHACMSQSSLRALRQTADELQRFVESKFDGLTLQSTADAVLAAYVNEGADLEALEGCFLSDLGEDMPVVAGFVDDSMKKKMS